MVSAQDPGQDHSALLAAKASQIQEEHNKQVVVDLWREVVDGRHEELINKYIAEDYIDHNPNLASGRAVYVARFKSRGIPPQPILGAPKNPPALVFTQGDLVAWVQIREAPDPKNPSQMYKYTWLEMWRVVDGMIKEHWDSSMRR
jgi:predicted SnoaL-like aldol condensation-catalyzing enzyme